MWFRSTIEAMSTKPQKSFSRIACSAFPFAAQEVAWKAEEELSGFVSQSDRFALIGIDICGDSVLIPYRIAFDIIDESDVVDTLSPAAVCLLSRGTNGYLRQRAIRRVMKVQKNWIVPYVVLLLGEYVVEIAEDVRKGLSNFDRALYANFVRENRSTMRLLRSRAIGYWNRYYSHDYPDVTKYPPIEVLREFETWAV